MQIFICIYRWSHAKLFTWISSVRYNGWFSSVQFSRSVVSNFAILNHSIPGLPVHHKLPEFTQVNSIESVMPSSHLILCRPLLLLPPIPPSIRVFSRSQLFAWGGQSTGVSASASVLPMNTQDWSPCSPRDSQESSPTPQFKSINFSALSFLHSPTLPSIHDHWKNNNLDQMDLCWQSNVSAF